MANGILNDRELMELAAKAAGITSDGVGYVSKTGCPMNWNPLDDDGDALRLAVTLEMAVKSSCGKSTAIVPASQVIQTETHGDDPYAATRRAIVRAAAAIGAAK